MRVGKRILRLLEIAEQNGNCVSNKILRQEWPEVVDSNCCKYLARAVEMKLLEVINPDDYPKQYRPAEDWKYKVFGDEPRKYVHFGYFTAEAREARKMAKGPRNPNKPKPPRPPKHDTPSQYQQEAERPRFAANSVFALGALYE